MLSITQTKTNCKEYLKNEQFLAQMRFYIYNESVVIFLVGKGVLMFSPEFMKFLINYQKPEFTPVSTKKEIKFKNKGGKLAQVLILNK